MTTCLREAVEKGLWQSFAAAALLERVLACKDAEALWAVKGGGELRDEDRRAVVEARVEPLEHRLRREVELVQDDPMARLVRVRVRVRIRVSVRVRGSLFGVRVSVSYLERRKEAAVPRSPLYLP